MKCYTIILFIVLISAPITTTKKILKRKKKEPFTATLIASLIFFTVVKASHAFMLYRKGKKAQEIALQMAKELGDHNQTVNSIITSCRNAHKLYDQKMIELVKMEKIFIKIRAYQLENNIQCHTPTNTNTDEDINLLENTLVNNIEKIVEEEKSRPNQGSHNEPSHVSEQEYLKRRDRGVKELVCYVANIKSHSTKMISQIEKLVSADVSNFCSADILPYFSQAIVSAKQKMNFIKQTETVLKQSTNFFYRLFLSKAHENLSSILDIGRMSGNSKQELNQLVHRIKSKEGIKKYDWKDVAVGIMRGGMEAGSIYMSIDGLFKEGLDALKNIGLAMSIGIPKDAGDYLARNRTHHLDKTHQRGVNTDGALYLPGYLGGLEWFGVGRIIFAMMESCYAIYNDKSFSTRVENQFGRAFSPIVGERDQFIQFTKLQQYQSAFQKIKINNMVEVLDKLTNHVQIDEKQYLDQYQDYRNKKTEYLKKGAQNSNQLLKEIPIIKYSPSLENMRKAFEGTNYDSFRLLMMKKELADLSPQELAFVNEGEYYTTIRTAYGIAELLSYFRDGFELIESYFVGNNALEQIETEISDQLDVYESLFEDDKQKKRQVEEEKKKGEKRETEQIPQDLKEKKKGEKLETKQIPQDLTEKKKGEKLETKQIPQDLKEKIKLYILAKRAKRDVKRKVLLYLTIIKKNQIMTKIDESTTDLKKTIEDRVKEHMKNEMIIYYKRHCRQLRFDTPLMTLVSKAELKIRILYDDYLGYFKIDREEYEKPEYRQFMICFNRLKPDKEAIDYFIKRKKPIILLKSSQTPKNMLKSSHFTISSKRISLSLSTQCHTILQKQPGLMVRTTITTLKC